jgi:threonine-phosphate decarboxylase
MYQHGGNIYTHPNMLDFSSNINPLGTPDRVRQAVLSSADSLIHYPDPDCRKLREAISQKEQLPSSHILCGNGAADLIFTLCYALRPNHALLPVPSFSEYEQALLACGCRIDHSFLSEKNRFAMTNQFLSDLKKEAYDIIFLCNPNNPTGQLIDTELLLEILHYCEQHQIFMVVDECFLDFTQKYHTASLISRLPTSKYLFILKAFTKMYAIPGLRLGYLLSGNTDLLETLHSFRQPWSVSTLAQAAGIAAFHGKEAFEWEEKTRRFLEKERTYLKNSLPLSPITGEANYLFFPSEKPLFEECKKHNILIRDCQNFISLEHKHYYRIAIKKREENEQLITLIRFLHQNH